MLSLDRFRQCSETMVERRGGVHRNVREHIRNCCDLQTQSVSIRSLGYKTTIERIFFSSFDHSTE